jgi:hypothetical protein
MQAYHGHKYGCTCKSTVHIQHWFRIKIRCDRGKRRRDHPLFSVGQHEDNLRVLFNGRTTTGSLQYEDNLPGSLQREDSYRDATTCNKATHSLQGSDYRSACQNYKYISNYSKDSTALYSCQGEKTRHGRHFWFV